MSNSSLVNYTRISPNSNNPRNHKIDKITIHHCAGNPSVELLGDMFSLVSRQASSNYGIGTDGRVGMYVEEYNRAWTSGNASNDHRAITIEVANDEIGGNWHVSDTALAKLIDLCVDICKRNRIASLNFTGDANGNLTMHKYFQNTNCPGPYLSSKFSYIADEVNARLGGTPSPQPTPQPSPTKYGIGTVVCTNTLATSSTGGMVYKGDWKGTITRIIEGAPYPYLLNDNTGWTNDIGIDSDPHVPNGSVTTSNPVDQILEKGSKVTSIAMSITGVKMVDGIECVNIPALGGWFPTKYVSEYDASDGAKDNYLATTKAKVYVDTCTVEQVDIKNNLVMIHGIWVKPAPLTEI